MVWPLASSRLSITDILTDRRPAATRWPSRDGNNPDGNLFAIWFDRRRDPANRNFDTRQATSTNDGRGWSQRRISTRSWNPGLGFFTSGAFIGDYNGLATSSRAVYPVWTDGRNNASNASALARATSLPTSSSASRPSRGAIGNRWPRICVQATVFAMSALGGDTVLTAKTEPARPRRQGLELRRWALLLPILALVAGGCAQPGTDTPQAAAKVATSPATVTVGPTDGGRTVDLKVRDRLIVELTGPTPPSRLRPAWTLRAPASKVLQRVPGNPDATRVMFVADQPGTIRLVLVKRLACYPPLRCPVAGPAGSESERMRPPLNGVTVPITVRVR